MQNQISYIHIKKKHGDVQNLRTTFNKDVGKAKPLHTRNTSVPITKLIYQIMFIIIHIWVGPRWVLFIALLHIIMLMHALSSKLL